MTFRKENFEVWLFFASSITFTLMPHPKPKKTIVTNDSANVDL